MIHTRLTLDRPLIIFDTETTGTDTATDRIIELGFQLYTNEGLQKEWRMLINPGVSIPAEASAVHGIYDRHMRLCAACQGRKDETGPVGYPLCECEAFHPVPSFQSLAKNLAKGFSDCDFAGKNIRFDLRIFNAEMVRAKVSWTYAGIPASARCPACALVATSGNLMCARCGSTTVDTPAVRPARIIDADRLEQIGEPRTLSDLYKKHTGQDMEGAHGALSDVKGSATVLVAQLDKYMVLPRTMDELHHLQWPGWIDTDGKFKFVNGVPTIMFGKHKGLSMKTVPRDYWEWMLKNDFSDEIKAFVREARQGRYPVPPVGNADDDTPED